MDTVEEEVKFMALVEGVEQESVSQRQDTRLFALTRIQEPRSGLCHSATADCSCGPAWNGAGRSLIAPLTSADKKLIRTQNG